MSSLTKAIPGTHEKARPSPAGMARHLAGATMEALVYHGPGQRSWEDKPRPELRETTDAVVRITTSTICGTDLHILKGDVPSVTDGRILGHEGVGVVEEVGAAVSGVRTGDKVLISCITSCGKCDFCRKGMYSHCRGGGWILGNTIDGTQAEYVRIPHADTSLYRLPPDADEEAMVMLSDILPTGFECGVLNGQVKPGDTRRDRRGRADRPRRAAHRAVLLAGRDRDDRPRRQPAPGGASPSAPRRSSTAATARPWRRSWR